MSAVEDIAIEYIGYPLISLLAIVMTWVILKARGDVRIEYILGTFLILSVRNKGGGCNIEDQSEIRSKIIQVTL